MWGVLKTIGMAVFRTDTGGACWHDAIGGGLYSQREHAGALEARIADGGLLER